MYHENLAVYKNASTIFSDEGFFGVRMTDFKIAQKHFHYNDTHKTSFLMLDTEFGTEFVEGTFLKIIFMYTAYSMRHIVCHIAL